MAYSRPPRWNFVSVAAFFVGFMFGFVAAANKGVRWDGGFAETVFGVVSISTPCAIGVVAGVIAWIRKERCWGVTAAGLLLNPILPMALLVSGILYLIMN